MTLSRVEKGRAEFEAKAGKNYLNPMGGVHGGFAAVALDRVAGRAVHSMLEKGKSRATADLNVKMLKPAPVDAVLKAEAKIIHRSKRIGVSEGVLKDAAEKPRGPDGHC